MSWAEDMGIDYGIIGIEGERLFAIKKFESHIQELKEELIRRKIYPFVDPSEFVWETKDGKKIPVGEMEESHIINCIKLCERRIKEINESFDNDYYNDEENVKFELNGFVDSEVEDTEND